MAFSSSLLGGKMSLDILLLEHHNTLLFPFIDFLKIFFIVGQIEMVHHRVLDLGAYFDHVWSRGNSILEAYKAIKNTIKLKYLIYLHQVSMPSNSFGVHV